MCLKADAPLWVLHAVSYDGFAVALIGLFVTVIPRLKEEVVKVELGELLGFILSLRVHELQFITCDLFDSRPCFRADTDPVNTSWSLDRPVCLDGNLDLESLKCPDER